MSIFGKLFAYLIVVCFDSLLDELQISICILYSIQYARSYWKINKNKAKYSRLESEEESMYMYHRLLISKIFQKFWFQSRLLYFGTLSKNDFYLKKTIRKKLFKTDRYVWGFLLLSKINWKVMALSSELCNRIQHGW